MNRARIQFICALLAIAVLACGSHAFAGNWTYNSSGSNARFGWSAGKHETFPSGSAHGSPVVTVNGFVFNNTYSDMNFRAQVTGPTTVNAGVSVKINTATSTPAGALPIDKIIVKEYGTWGGSLADIRVQADFNITEYVTGYGNDTGPISLPTATYYANGTWATEYTFTPGPGNPGGAPWTNPLILSNFKIRVRNLIGVQGSVPGTFIEKKGLEIWVPEPATLLTLVVFGPLALRRARR